METAAEDGGAQENLSDGTAFEDGGLVETAGVKVHTKPRYYRMDGSAYEGSPEEQLLAWARDLEAGRAIRDKLLWNGLWVSTIWLGLDHSWGGPPLIFETMIFDRLNREPGCDVAQYRYSTLDEAQAGHDALTREWSRFWPTVKRWFLDAWAEGD